MTQAAPAAQAAPVAPSVSISLQVDAINVVLASLAKQPFEAVADLITAIRTQAIEQLQTSDQEIKQLPPEGK